MTPTTVGTVRCVCGHLDVFHNLSTTAPRRRTACSVHTGPQATPCGCKKHEPAKEGP